MRMGANAHRNRPPPRFGMALAWAAIGMQRCHASHAEDMSKCLGLLPSRQKDEMEADRIAVKLTARGGYDSRAPI